MTIRKDFDGDTLKRAIDTKPQTTVKHPGKPFWLRRNTPAKKES